MHCTRMSAHSVSHLSHILLVLISPIITRRSCLLRFFFFFFFLDRFAHWKCYFDNSRRGQVVRVLGWRARGISNTTKPKPLATTENVLGEGGEGNRRELVKLSSSEWTSKWIEQFGSLFRRKIRRRKKQQQQPDSLWVPVHQGVWSDSTNANEVCASAYIAP